MLVAQRFLQIRAKGGQRGAQGGNVGVQPRQIGGRVFGMLGRKRAHQRRTKWHHSQLQQAQHFGARHPGPVERDDFCGIAPTAQAREFAGPKGLFAAHILVEFGQTAHHTQVGYRGRSVGGRRLRPGQGCRPPEHAAAQRSSAAAKQLR